MAIKTIKCNKCGAEQAIIPNDDGKMNCVFCGEEIENLPEISEGEDFYGYNEPQKNEPVGEAIKTEFILTEDEVAEALITSGRLKERKIIPIIETVLLSLLSAIYIFQIICEEGGYKPYGIQFKNGATTMEYILFGVMLVLIPMVWILPKRARKKYVKSSTSGLNVMVDFYENLAEIITSDGKESWQLLYTENYNVMQSENLLLITLADKQLLVIPKRAFKNDEYEKAVGLLEKK